MTCEKECSLPDGPCPDIGPSDGLEFNGVEDSGHRVKFESGAVRDRAKGKGRYDLMSSYALNATARALNDLLRTETTMTSDRVVLGDCLSLAMKYGFAVLGNAEREGYAAKAAACVHWLVHVQECALRKLSLTPGHYVWGSNTRAVIGTLSPLAVHRLARHFENGARKYDDRNWEKGIPLSRFIDSGLRHLLKLMLGKTEEDHAAAAEWNFHCFIHTSHEIETGRLPKELNDLSTPE
jgi:hypothetical protein